MVADVSMFHMKQKLKVLTRQELGKLGNLRDLESRDVGSNPTFLTKNFLNFLNCSLSGQNAPEGLIAFGENESSNLSGLGIKWVGNSIGRVEIL